MRSMILASLVLLPALAHAQFAAAPQTLVASSAKPAVLGVPTPFRPAGAFSETIQEQMVDAAFEDSLSANGGLEYTFRGTAGALEAPRLIHTVVLGLSQEQLAEQPQITNVTVRVTVDEYGFPRNLRVAQSAGASVDSQALRAVGQYRFKAATVDNIAVQSAVLVTLKLRKQ
jgi:TonB family protein